jgi:tetratricopeptide (TPR) repeat protein
MQLASVYQSLGIRLRGASRHRDASQAFDRARSLCEKLVEANPAEPRFVHELVRALGNSSAGAYSSPDDVSSAAVISTLERASTLLEAAIQASPSNLVLRADLAWISELLGTRMKSAGREAEAMTAYRRALDLRDSLSKTNPTSTRHLERQLSLLGSLVLLHRQTGDVVEARLCYDRARQLAANAGSLASHPEVLQELVDVLEDWAAMELKAGNIPQAAAKYELLDATLARLLDTSPSSPGADSRTAGLIRRRGVASQALNRTTEAIARYRQSLALLEAISQPSPIDLYDIACCHALISSAVGTAESREAEARLAVDGVRRALEAGYSERPWIREQDPNLRSIRPRADFQLLMMDRRFPAQPFAPGN